MDSNYGSSWQKCPRCGEYALEQLETYNHCVECLYSNAIDTYLARATKRSLERSYESDSMESDEE